jgi:hypothetical protein
MTTKSLSGLLVSAMIALSVLPVVAQPTQPQIFYKFQGDLLANSGSLTIASNSTLVVTNSGFATLKQGRGIALYPVITGTAATTSNTFLQFGVSPGTNSTPSSIYNGPTNGPGSILVFTNNALLFTNTLSGTNPIQPYILIPPSVLDNGGNLQLVTAQSQATNATGTTLSHIYWLITSQ